MSQNRTRITITEDGPYVVADGPQVQDKTIVADADGNSVMWDTTGSHGEPGKYALCRCGQSGSKPFCDGSHAREGFNGKETAPRKPYEELADVTEGPALDLHDREDLCATARFCDHHGSVWEEVSSTDKPDVAEMFTKQVNQCPSGRLRAHRAETKDQVEWDRAPAISVTQDPQEDCSAAIFVEGGIHIESHDGHVYEPRNRVALCRCGASGNKPFCDGSHIKIGFSDKS